MVAYIEQPIQLEGVELRDIATLPHLTAYLERLKKHQGSDGLTNGEYDYRYDCNKFCRKVFVQDACFDDDEHLFWFDADSYLTKDIPEKLLKSIVEKPFCYLGRKGENSYTETGFLGFNTKHSDFLKFREKYLSYFTTGRIFSQLKGWHDCIAFDYARQGISGLNLSPDGHGVGNVIGTSKVGGYIVHMKGARKFSDKHKRAASI